jgi:asparagine synthase (glutamine-hydrolysing)
MRTGFEIALSADGRPEAKLFRAAEAGTPQGALVTAARDGDAVCAFVGRLHFRADLLRRLPTRPGDSPAELALAAYRAGGPSGLSWLEGEFAVVVADAARGCAFALRDPLGSWPLYHGAEAGAVRVGTGLIDLARQMRRQDVNLDYLGEYLMWPFAGAELPTEQTAFASLRRVPPGRLLRLAPAGAADALHDNDWSAGAPDVSGLTEEEAGRHFAELFRDEVRERLSPAGRTAAHLSGGMDSSAVACVARLQHPQPRRRARVPPDGPRSGRPRGAAPPRRRRAARLRLVH